MKPRSQHTSFTVNSPIGIDLHVLGTKRPTSLQCLSICRSVSNMQQKPQHCSRTLSPFLPYPSSPYFPPPPSAFSPPLSLPLSFFSFPLLPIFLYFPVSFPLIPFISLPLPTTPLSHPPFLSPSIFFSLPLIFHFSPASQHPLFIYNNYSPAITLSVSSPFSSPERVGVNTACFQCCLSFGYCYGFQFHCSVCVGRPISTKYSVYNVQCSVVHRFSRPTGWVGSGWIFSGLMWVLVYYVVICIKLCVS